MRMGKKRETITANVILKTSHDEICEQLLFGREKKRTNIQTEYDNHCH